MSRSASKIRDGRSSVQKEFASLKNRRSVSVDTRARGSYVPEKKRPSSEERKSGNKLFRWTGARKSSINLTDAKRKDVRPLTDKTYQKRKITELVEFLEETGFSPPIAASKLMAPSRKDFENLFQFLYRYFDPAYEVKKIEEEAPKILKNLCYPFTVNKSAFVYVARTNWPSLLGVLIWLMDLSKFAIKVDMKSLFETAGDDESAEIHQILVRYICQRHHSGIDNEEEENAVYHKIIKSYVLREELDDLIAKKEEKELLLASVEKEIDDMKALADRNALLEKNVEKYEDYILKMKTHYQNKSALCEQLLQELKLKESQLKTHQEEVSKKQDAYDAQGFDGKKHLSYFEIQKKDLGERLEKKRNTLKKLQDKYWEAEIEYTKNHEKAIAAAEDSRELSNSIVELLKSILDPLRNIKIPQIQHLRDNFVLDFPVCEFHPSDHSSKSVEAFTNAWINIAEKIKGVDEILKKICATLNQKLTEIEMKKSEVSMKLKLLTLVENKEEQDLNSKKKTVDEEMSTLETQCEKNHEIIKTLQEENSKLEKLFRELVEEKDGLEEFLEKKGKELKEYLIEQKEIFAFFSNSEEQAMLLSQTYGNEIVEKLQEIQDM